MDSPYNAMHWLSGTVITFCHELSQKATTGTAERFVKGCDLVVQHMKEAPDESNYMACTQIFKAG